MSESSKNSRTKILEAAAQQFITHGYEGARLQAVSDSVGVTKAMIHYYFNTKKELFEQVYRQSVEQVFGNLSDTLSQDMVLFKKIEALIESCLNTAEIQPELLSFVITESSRKAEWIQQIMEEKMSLDLQKFDKELQEAASNYQITSVSADTLLLQICSLCYYPIVARNLNNTLFQLPRNEEDENPTLQPQKGIIIDTILNWLTA